MKRCVLKDLFTESDNETWDVGRLQWAVGTIVYFALSAYAYVWKGQPFDPIAWGTGFGAVMAGGGGMVWMKGKEPGQAPRISGKVPVDPPIPVG